MRALVIALFSLIAVSAANAQSAPTVANTTWCVHASWEKNPFLWVFDNTGRYKDTDGPTGSWSQDGVSLTLIADAGFTYKATLTGNAGSGMVYRVSDESVAGSFRIARMAANARANCRARATS